MCSGTESGGGGARRGGVKACMGEVALAGERGCVVARGRCRYAGKTIGMGPIEGGARHLGKSRHYGLSRGRVLRDGEAEWGMVGAGCVGGSPGTKGHKARQGGPV